jgi:RHS repeat-associated protein
MTTANGYWPGNSFSYDERGNRKTTTVGGAATFAYSTSTDRLDAASGVNFYYDPNGNLTSDSTGRAYTYTPSNMMETALANWVSTTYRYDGDDVRKAKISAGDETYFIHGPGGQLLAEFQDINAIVPAHDYVYLGSRLLADVRLSAIFADGFESGDTSAWSSQLPFASMLAGVARDTDVLGGVQARVWRYYDTDGVGSVRVITDEGGDVVERHDYLPFGEECTTGACETNPQGGGGDDRKFTGKERDEETGLDYFGARYYGSAIARFTTLDPAMTFQANLVDPQRWNRYAYAKNNPLVFVDPDGRETVLLNGKHSSDNVFGHTAIAIDGEVFSFGTNYTNGGDGVRDWGGNEAAYLAAQSDKRETTRLILDVSDTQEQALLHGLRANNPNAPGAAPYAVGNNSCVTVCERALERAGILPNQPGPVTIDRAGNALQAGAPRSLTPGGLADRTKGASRFVANGRSRKDILDQVAREHAKGGCPMSMSIRGQVSVILSSLTFTCVGCTGTPPLRLVQESDTVTMDLQTLGEYQTTIRRIRLTERVHRRVVFEVVTAAGTPQLSTLSLALGENLTTIPNVQSGTYRVVAPQASSHFVLNRETEYLVEVWGDRDDAMPAAGVFRFRKKRES